MSQREKVLAIVVGGAVALLINVFVIKFFLKNHSDLKGQIYLNQQKVEALKQRESQRTLWSERDAWLSQSLPKLGDHQVANRQLSEAVKDVAKKHTVTLESPNPGLPINTKTHTALGVKISAKAAWTPMFDFLRELQAPGQFIVLDPVEIKVDPSDKTQLRAEVTVSKWFAPATGG